MSKRVNVRSETSYGRSRLLVIFDLSLHNATIVNIFMHDLRLKEKESTIGLLIPDWAFSFSPSGNFFLPQTKQKLIITKFSLDVERFIVTQAFKSSIDKCRYMMKFSSICYLLSLLSIATSDESTCEQCLFFRSMRFKQRPPKTVKTKAPTQAPSEAPSGMPSQEPDPIVACSDGLTVQVQVDHSTEFAISTGLCILWKDGKPIARSYEGNDWEPYYDANNAPRFSCESEYCTSTGLKGSYRLVSVPASRDRVDKTARFLEQATFGPKIDEIRSVGTDFVSWIRNQVAVPVTSHRAIYREFLNHRYPHTSYQGRVTHPCETGTRYRKYAFTDKDWQAEVEIRTVSGTQKSFWVKNQFRTVVNAQSIHIGSVQDHLRLPDGK